jgi:hypothetical protein
MHAIETTATVAPDGSLTIDGPVNVPPGRHRVVVVFGEQVSATEYHSPSEWPPGYFEKTFGALADHPLTREPQGDYEQREALK